MRQCRWLIPLAALVAIAPLLAFGYSCGHDFDFHVVNWIEVAAQWHQGILYPHWAISPAYGAGEPRFVFYPPLSWMLGALLGFVLPWSATPTAYTFIVLVGCGFSMHRLARARTWPRSSPQTALLAAVLYMANPYLLFVTYERTAYAELMAAMWLPILFLGILRRIPTIPGIAVPVALLWLTNAPAAVMGCYTLAFVATVRVAAAVAAQPTVNNARKLFSKPMAQSSQIRSSKAPSKSDENPQPHPNPQHNPGVPLLAHSTKAASPARLALAYTAGTVLGLGLAGFYIVPAAYERRWVQIQLAVVPGMRIRDGFLFGHTADPDHDRVLWTASWICVTLLVSAAVAAAAAWPRRGSLERPPAASALSRRTIVLCVSCLALLAFFLQLPISAPVWTHLPELPFLQFPWRWLAILSVGTLLLLALAITEPRRRRVLTAIAILGPMALSPAAYRVFHQACDPQDTIAARLLLFRSGAGSEPTDEYTPQTADNDVLKQGLPTAWLEPLRPGALELPAPTLPQAAGSAQSPGDQSSVQEEPAATTEPVPIPSTAIHTAEHWQLSVYSGSAQLLTLRLRDYPAWRVRINGALVANRPERDDGLMALPLAAGRSDIDIRYGATTDQRIGDGISVLALLALLLGRLFTKPACESSKTDEAC